MDHERFRELVGRLYAVVGELEDMFPGRHFTPDGHMVGSLGECLVADAYGLHLEPASTGGYDATAPSGLRVEVKATQGNRVSFRSCPQHTIVVRINRDGSFTEIYNGPGTPVWERFEGKMRPSNGQFSIGLAALASLAETVDERHRLPRCTAT